MGIKAGQGRAIADVIDRSSVALFYLHVFTHVILTVAL